MPIDPLRELVLPRLQGVVKSGGEFKARCPAHEDRHASLTVGIGHKQPVVLRCHAGCESDDIVAALGLTLADLSQPQEQREAGEWTPAGPAVAVYDYVDEDGKLLFQVLRTANKDFRQRVPDPLAKSGWTWKLGDTRRVLYRLPKVIEAIEAGQEVWIVEGEKDVHSLESIAVTATCNPGGAGKWRPDYSDVFRGASVTVVADRDAPGQAHARQVATALHDVADRVRIVEPAAGKDITDHLAAGHSLDEVGVTRVSEDPPDLRLAMDLWEFITAEDVGYDWVIPYLLERGDRFILTGFEGLGKALAVDTPIPTPKGWTTMGQLAAGDEVFGPDGQPAQIIAATDVMYDRPCYRVQFSDGAEVIADAQHQWVTETLASREASSRFARRPAAVKLRGTDQRHKRVHYPAAVTTEQVAATLHARGGHALNHSVAVAAPLEYPRQELPIDPYVLGAWLGDGATDCGVFTCADDEIIERIQSAGVPMGRRTATPYGWAMTSGDRSHGARRVSIQARLRALGVLGNKHIPEAYLHASVSQRLALLQGLMDTDGTVGIQVSGMPLCEFSVCSERLATDVLELLHGLGVKVTMRSGPATLNGRKVGTRWRLPFQTDLPVFHLSRKAERLKPLRTRRAKLRYIVAVEPINSVPVRCIQVDRADGMFVAGRECIPTHNSTLARQLVVTTAAGLHPFTFEQIAPRKVLFIDCENSERQSRRKFRKLAELSERYGRRVGDGMLRLIHRPAGIDLTRDDDASWLLERVTVHKPDLLFIGPFYRLHNGSMNDEEPCRRVVGVLDYARVRAECALVIEAHSPHGEAGLRRSVRPVGSSLLLRWPEFGYGLAPANEDGSRVDFKRWRGPRDDREWPKRLERAAADRWPWWAPIDGMGM